MNKAIGNKLKQLRKSNGFTLDEIAERLNISTSTYSRMEKGETATWTSKIDKICSIYKIEEEELILPLEKYIIISENQKRNIISNTVVNQLSEKVIELYERMIVEKDKKIEELEKKKKR